MIDWHYLQQQNMQLDLGLFPGLRNKQSEPVGQLSHNLCKLMAKHNDLTLYRPF